MTVTRDALITELKVLRKGRGMGAGTLSDRIGPNLLEACGLRPEVDAATLRQTVARRLREWAEYLPGDLRVCVVAAFGLEKAVDLPFYQDRVRWAAEQLQRDDRTVRRRIDSGIEQLVDLALAPVAAGDGDGETGWRTEKLRVAVSLEQPGAEVLEFRTIAADRDGLTEIDLAWTVSRAQLSADLPIQIIYGGTLVRRQLETADRIGFLVRLATPLRRGEVVEVAVRYRVPPDQELRPHYVCTPLHPCAQFELVVRFGPDRLPTYVWELHGVLQGDIEDKVAPRTLVPINPLGEVRVAFRRLKPSRSYGIRWE